MKEISRPGNSRTFSNTRYGNFYDVLVGDDDQLLLNEYENHKSFKQVSSKFWNLKDRIIYIQDEVQAMLD